MKLTIYSYDPVTKEISLTAELKLRKGITKKRAHQIAKEQMKQISDNACYEIKNSASEGKEW